MATQYEKNQAARQARESGLCMKCNEPIETDDRETLTKDGKLYANCRRCRPNKQMVRPAAVKPKRVDANDEVHFTETREFKVYALQVAGFVRRMDENPSENYKGVTLGDVHRELGDERRAWTLDALNEIRTFRKWMVPERYTLRPPVVRSIPLTEAKPFPGVPYRYKTNERPSGLGLPPMGLTI